jgi:hypothetical protein
MTKNKHTSRLVYLVSMVLAVASCATGCAKKAPPATASDAPVAKHEHHPPHGGTPVVLGDEAAHVELVLDAATGRLQAYVLDGELENFIRVSDPTLTIVATVDGAERVLALAAVASPASGETVGDTSLFETQADWLKTTPRFAAKLVAITVRGTAYSEVVFAFPEGNDHD